MIDSRLIVADGVRTTLYDGGRGRTFSWREARNLPWDDFSVVLGGGGITGGAFEAGVLLALETDHGVTCAGARRIIGTSAGSIVGSLLALGMNSADVVALLTDQPSLLSTHGGTFGAQRMAGPPTIPMGGVWKFPTPARAARVARHGVNRRFPAMLLEMLQVGEFDLRPQLEFLRTTSWPGTDGQLTVCVTDRHTGKRVVLTEQSGVSLMDAVASSCAVPTIMSPVSVGAATYVDGGLSSPTNADLAVSSDGPALVLVISPMSGRSSMSALGKITSKFSAHRLRSEINRFGGRQQVLVIEPANGLSPMVTDDALGDDRTLDVVTSAFVGLSRH